MEKVLLVGAGGFAGSIGRYLLAGGVQRLSPAATFPHGTLVVNVLGCLAIGFLGGMAEARNLFGPEVRLLIFIGVLGGFTTFSTFAWETLAMLRGGQLARALANASLHLLGCMLAVWLGDALARGIGAPHA
jgi:CrcB protein